MLISAEVREYLKLLIEFAQVVIWPIFVTILLLRFKGVISSLLARSKGLTIKVAGNEIQFTDMEVSEALTDLFNEIDTLLKDHLTLEEKKLFLLILAQPVTPKVIDMLPRFSREKNSPELKMLRALRGVYFIRPVEGSTWEADKHIEVTNLGKIVAKHKRNELMADFTRVLAESNGASPQLRASQ